MHFKFNIFRVNQVKRKRICEISHVPKIKLMGIISSPLFQTIILYPLNPIIGEFLNDPNWKPRIMVGLVTPHIIPLSECSGSMFSEDLLPVILSAIEDDLSVISQCH